MADFEPFTTVTTDLLESLLGKKAWSLATKLSQYRFVLEFVARLLASFGDDEDDTVTNTRSHVLTALEETLPAEDDVLDEEEYDVDEEDLETGDDDETYYGG